MRTWIVATLVAIAGNAQAATLAELLEAAWQRQPQAQALEARRAEAAAARVAAEALLPGAPALTLSNRNDRLTENRGQWENEIEFSAPLWLPGQRAAQLTLAEVESAGPNSAARLARLALAGELRRIVWQTTSARAEAELAGTRRNTAEALAADVERRVRAGDLAHSDALFARSAALGARSAHAAALTRLRQAFERLRGLTGSDRVPDPLEEPLRDVPAADSHPQLAAADLAVGRARAQAGVAATSPREAPEFGVQYQRGRDAFGAASHDSVRLQIKIPFATEARNRPMLAGAEARLTESIAQARYLRSVLQVEEREAAIELENARWTLPLAELRRDAAREAERLSARAFHAGEIGLADLLRASTLAAESEAEAAAARIAVSRAIAMLNQARGWMP